MKNLQKEFVGGCTPDPLNSYGLFPAETQIQVLWTARFLLCALTLSHYSFFSCCCCFVTQFCNMAPDCIVIASLVRPFHALIPDVLSKVMNHTCTSESLLANETYAPNSAVLS